MDCPRSFELNSEKQMNLWIDYLFDFRLKMKLKNLSFEQEDLDKIKLYQQIISELVTKLIQKNDASFIIILLRTIKRRELYEFYNFFCSTKSFLREISEDIFKKFWGDNFKTEKTLIKKAQGNKFFPSIINNRDENVKDIIFNDLSNTTIAFSKGVILGKLNSIPDNKFLFTWNKIFDLEKRKFVIDKVESFLFDTERFLQDKVELIIEDWISFLGVFAIICEVDFIYPYYPYEINKIILHKSFHI